MDGVNGTPALATATAGVAAGARRGRVASAPDRRSRAALATVFFVNGLVLASWVPHVPAAKDAHGLSDGALGLVLLAMAIGAVLAMPVAGWLVGRLGSRRMTSLAGVGFCLLLPLPLVSPNVAWLVLSLLALGAGSGTLDVSMNAQAVALERRYGRPILSSFHGLFSLGGFAGAALAGLAMGVGMGDRAHVTATALGGAGAVLAVLAWLLPSDGPAGRPGPVFVRPGRALLGLGLLAFGGLLAEGAMADWSAVYLRDALGTSPAVAAAGFTAFSLAMAAGRFGGDRLAARLHPDRLLRASAALAAAGLGTALLLGRPAAAIAGFGLVGLGIANVIPILFSAAGRVRGVPAGTALAAVATTGYLGFLAGPPLIGLTAELAGLPPALGLVSACCALVALGARLLPRTDG
jgi:MFS family permease